MFRNNFTYFKLMQLISLNKFIYFLTQIPTLGKKVQKSRILENKSKWTILFIFRYIKNIIFSTITRIIYIGIIFIVNKSIINKWIPEIEMVSNEIFYCIIIGIGLLVEIFHAGFIFDKHSEEDYLCVKIFKVNPKSYYLSKILYKNLQFYINYLIAILIIFRIINQQYYQGIILVTVLLAIRLVSIVLYILFKKGYKVVTAIGVILGLVTILMPYLLKREILKMSILTNYIVIAVILLIIVISSSIIYRFKSYRELALKLLKYKNLDILDTMDVDIGMSVEKLEDIDTKDMSVETQKTGYEYLHDMFFKRNKQLFFKAVRLRVIISIIAGIILCIISYFDLIEKEKITVGIAFTILLIYNLSTSVGEKIIKSLFVNIDMYMLKYNFYKKEDSIKKCLKIRAQKIVRLNLVPIAVLSTLLMISLGINGEWIKGIEYSLINLICGLFFSVHHLYMYYIFQPYTEQLVVKNTTVKAINKSIYLIAFLGRKELMKMGDISVVIILLAIVIYVIIGAFITVRLASKRFRLH